MKYRQHSWLISRLSSLSVRLSYYSIGTLRVPTIVLVLPFFQKKGKPKKPTAKAPLGSHAVDLLIIIVVKFRILRILHYYYYNSKCRDRVKSARVRPLQKGGSEEVVEKGPAYS